MTPELTSYLSKWFNTATKRKAAQGTTVVLTIEEFHSMFNKSQLIRLERAIVQGKLQSMQSRTNESALVLTWVSYKACSANKFNADTACVVSRRKSRTINKIAKGDKMRASHVKNMGRAVSKALTGVAKAEEHKAGISNSMIGKNAGRVQSAAEKEKRSQAAKERHAKARAAKELLK